MLKHIALLASLFPILYAQSQSSIIDVPDAPIPIRILKQSPADTNTDLQVICLFRSSPQNTLHGALIETNEKLNGLLDRIRKPELFRGDLGETLLLVPPKRTPGARKLLLVGLGDSETFSPQRMQLVGEILYSEAGRLGAPQPFFAPTIIDGGVTQFTTGQISEEVIAGFLRAAAIEKLLYNTNVPSVTALTYLAGPKFAANTLEGIEKAIAAPRK
ncbi:MAG: M17 family peptidase N-terminal domain-containing protein [Bryobacteraceae bacterium]